MKYYDQDKNVFTTMEKPTTAATTITTPVLTDGEFYDPEEDCYYDDPTPATAVPAPVHKQPKYAAGESPMDALKMIGLIVLVLTALALLFPNAEPTTDAQHEAVWWNNLQG